MKPIDPDGFEAMFRKDADPWNYAASPFEAWKRDRLLKACGDRLYGRGLELACANGETTKRLARRCLNLLAVDSSATVLAEARRRTKNLDNVDLRQATLPAQTPSGVFDLIVASEILYYLSLPDMRILLGQLQRSLAPGGRLVVLHHILPFADANQIPALAQRRARETLSLDLSLVHARRERRFEVFAVEKPRSHGRVSVLMGEPRGGGVTVSNLRAAALSVGRGVSLECAGSRQAAGSWDQVRQNSRQSIVCGGSDTLERDRDD